MRVRGHYFPCSAGSHTRRRASMHIQTYATNTLKVPPPTAVHPIASRFLSRAVPPYTLTRRFLRSLPHSRPPWDSRYSLADNLAELVNIVEENLVVRHSDDEEEEEVEGVDRARNLHASGDASRLCECVTIRSACKYAPFSDAPVVIS